MKQANPTAPNATTAITDTIGVRWSLIALAAELVLVAFVPVAVPVEECVDVVVPEEMVVVVTVVDAAAPTQPERGPRRPQAPFGPALPDTPGREPWTCRSRRLAAMARAASGWGAAVGSGLAVAAARTAVQLASTKCEKCMMGSVQHLFFFRKPDN